MNWENHFIGPLDILPLASNTELPQSKFMKKLIEGEEPEPIKMHFPLNY